MPLSAATAPIAPVTAMGQINFGGEGSLMEPISPTATSASGGGVKRKRSAEPKFYAVRVGHVPGVYHTYKECLEQVKGFKNATFKSFPTLTEAEQFVAGQDPTSGSGSSSGQFKFYAVRSGRVPGIYTDWPSAQKQIKGWTKPKHQKFSTRAEAQRFMEAGGPPVVSTMAVDDTEPARLPQPVQHTQPRSFMEADVVEPYSLSLHNQSQMIAPQMHQQLLQYAQMHEQQLQQEQFQQQQLQQQQQQLQPPPPQPPLHRRDPPQPVAKKSKRINGTASRTLKEDLPEYNEQEFEAGLGPLPPGAEDGFDPNVLLHSLTGNVVYKTQAQREATKLQPIPPGSDAMLRIYTDGSSLRNGQKGAFAGVGVYFGPEDRRNLSEALPGPRQTNQRAELTAMLRALETVPRDRDVTIVTDSQYSINCVTKWYVQWRQRNWKNAAGKPVENRDLIETLLDRIEGRASLRSQTEFEWIKGHDHHPGNEAADRLAVDGARKAAALGGSLQR